MLVMGCTEKQGTTRCWCLIPGSLARHWLLHLKALGPCLFAGGAVGLGKQWSPGVGGLCWASTVVSTQGLITCLCTSNLPCQLHQTAWGYQPRVNRVPRKMQPKALLTPMSTMREKCRQSAPLDPAGFRNCEKPAAHRKETRRNWCGADLKQWPKSA